MQSINQFSSWFKSFILFCFSLCSASTALCDEPLSFSGSLDLRGVDRLEQNSAKEDPSLIGKIKLDSSNSAWTLHSWLEGGWDGSVKLPAQDRSLFKNYDQVYQSNSPYLE